MKLRELFDKLTPGMLDGEVKLRIVFNAGTIDEISDTVPASGVIFTDEGEAIIIAVDKATSR